MATCAGKPKIDASSGTWMIPADAEHAREESHERAADEPDPRFERPRIPPAASVDEHARERAGIRSVVRLSGFDEQPDADEHEHDAEIGSKSARGR